MPKRKREEETSPRVWCEVTELEHVRDWLDSKCGNWRSYYGGKHYIAQLAPNYNVAFNSTKVAGVVNHLGAPRTYLSLTSDGNEVQGYNRGVYSDGLCSMYSAYFMLKTAGPTVFRRMPILRSVEEPGFLDHNRDLLMRMCHLLEKDKSFLTALVQPWKKYGWKVVHIQEWLKGKNPDFLFDRKRLDLPKN